MIIVDNMKVSRSHITNKDDDIVQLLRTSITLLIFMSVLFYVLLLQVIFKEIMQLKTVFYIEPYLKTITLTCICIASLSWILFTIKQAEALYKDHSNDTYVLVESSIW